MSEDIDKVFHDQLAGHDAGGFQEAHWASMDSMLNAALPVGGVPPSPPVPPPTVFTPMLKAIAIGATVIGTSTAVYFGGFLSEESPQENQVVVVDEENNPESQEEITNLNSTENTQEDAVVETEANQILKEEEKNGLLDEGTTTPGIEAKEFIDVEQALAANTEPKIVDGPKVFAKTGALNSKVIVRHKSENILDAEEAKNNSTLEGDVALEEDENQRVVQKREPASQGLKAESEFNTKALEVAKKEDAENELSGPDNAIAVAENTVDSKNAPDGPKLETIDTQALKGYNPEESAREPIFNAAENSTANPMVEARPTIERMKMAVSELVDDSQPEAANDEAHLIPEKAGFPIPVLSKFRFSILVGTNYSEGLANQWDKARNTAWFTGGLGLKYHYNNRFTVNLHAQLLSRKGNALSYSSTSIKYFLLPEVYTQEVTIKSMDYLHLPLTVTYRIKDKYHVGAGGYSSILMGTSGNRTDYYSSALTFEERTFFQERGYRKGLATTVYGITLMGEMDFWRGFSVGIMGNLGLRQTFDPKVYRQTSNTKNWEGQVYLRWNW